MLLRLGAQFIVPKVTEFEPRIAAQTPHTDVDTNAEVISVAVHLQGDAVSWRCYFCRGWAYRAVCCIVRLYTRALYSRTVIEERRCVLESERGSGAPVCYS